MTIRSNDTGILILRVATGLSLALAHGINKVPPADGFVAGVAGMGFPVAIAFAWLSAVAELGGGLMIAAGLFTRVGAALIAINMVVATFLMQAGDPYLERELAILYLVIALALLFTGGGRYSVDGARARSGELSPRPLS